MGVLLGTVAYALLLSACTVEAGTPTPTPSSNLEARVKALEEIVVYLNDQLRGHDHGLTAAPHTHQNDHYHSLSDNFLDEGYHTHSEYAEAGHDHWGYADEFHRHDRGW